MKKHECEAITLALQMAAAHRARVTLLHIVAPFLPRSVHWLDAIDNLHRALSGQRRDTASTVQRGRAEVAAFLESEISGELRESLEIHIDCRVGDVATEIARFSNDRAVDLVVLCDLPSTWRPLAWTGVSQRIIRLLTKPFVLIPSQTRHPKKDAGR